MNRWDSFSQYFRGVADIIASLDYADWTAYNSVALFCTRYKPFNISGKIFTRFFFLLCLRKSLLFVCKTENAKNIT